MHAALRTFPPPDVDESLYSDEKLTGFRFSPRRIFRPIERAVSDIARIPRKVAEAINQAAEDTAREVTRVAVDAARELDLIANGAGKELRAIDKKSLRFPSIKFPDHVTIRFRAVIRLNLADWAKAEGAFELGRYGLECTSIPIRWEHDPLRARYVHRFVIYNQTSDRIKFSYHDLQHSSVATVDLNPGEALMLAQVEDFNGMTCDQLHQRFRVVSAERIPSDEPRSFLME